MGTSEDPQSSLRRLHYEESCRITLREFLGWGEERIQKWIEQWRDIDEGAEPNPIRPQYEECWRIALRELLGWSEERIGKWIESRKDIDQNEMAHEGALYYIVGELIPESLCLHPERLKDENIIQFAGRLEYDLNHGFDRIMSRDERSRFDQHMAALGPSFTLSWLKEHLRSSVAKGLWFSEAEPHLFDWKKARERVEAVLKEYGEKIPRQ